MEKKENRTVYIHIRCTPDEKEFITRKAKEHKLSLSEYVLANSLADNPRLLIVNNKTYNIN